MPDDFDSLDPNLIEAIVHQESGGNPNAVSATGARGLMQILPSTAQTYGFDPDKLFDPEYNRIAGHTVLSDYLKKAGGDIHTALMMYKEGPAGYKTHRERAEQYADSVLGVHHARLEGFEPEWKPDAAVDPGQRQADYSFGPLKRLAAIPGEAISEGLKPALERVLGEENAAPLANAIGGAFGGLASGMPEEGAIPEPGWEVLPPDRPSFQQPPVRAQQPGPEEVIEPEPHINDIATLPAIRANGEVVSGRIGDRHIDIMDRTPNLPARVEHGFIGRDGQFLTRTQARELLNQRGANLPAGKPEAIDMIPVGGPQRPALPPPEEKSPAISEPGWEPAPQQGQAPVMPVGTAERPLVWIKPGDAKLEPETFQYKIQVNPKTGLSRDLGKYDWQVAGNEKLWWDADKQQLYVAHGHHRHNAAVQSSEPGVYAILWDSGDSEPYAAAHNVTKEQARAWGAMENFKDGRGTAVDAANYLRNAPDLTEAKMNEMGDLDLKQSMMQQALGLRNLTEPVWYEVAIGRLKPEVGAIIGRELRNPRDQVNAWKAYSERENEGRPYPLSKFEDVVRLMADVPEAEVNPDEGQGTLGGWNFKETRSTVEEQADILGYAKRELGTEGKTMGTAVRQKQRLERGQTKIDVETAKPLAEEAKHRLSVIKTYSAKTRGSLPNIRAVLDRYGRYLAEKPSQRKAILQEAFEALVKAADTDLPQAQPIVETGQESLF